MKRGKIAFTMKSRWLLFGLWVGLASVSPQRSHAEAEDGKNNASGGVVALGRDPFWPVGHTPKQELNQEIGKAPNKASQSKGAIDWEEAMKQVVINGVSSRADDEYIAVINNEVKSVGESVSVRYDGAQYIWKVERITPPGSVKLRRHLVE